MRYFVLSLFLFTGCNSKPSIPVDLEWSFYAIPGEESKACLSESDVVKLKEALDRCQAATKGN